jgi:HPt (histidine-containing phosphotransfer) domain-containing protein
MQVFDSSSFLDNLGGDRELAVEIVGVLRHSARGILELVREAASRGDADGLHRAAHQLKGALASVGALASSDAAAELERCGRDRAMAEAAAALDALDAEMQRLAPELDAFVSGA